LIPDGHAPPLCRLFPDDPDDAKTDTAHAGEIYPPAASITKKKLHDVYIPSIVKTDRHLREIPSSRKIAAGKSACEAIPPAVYAPIRSMQYSGGNCRPSSSALSRVKQVHV
jgi:hypothetical protein